MNDEPRTSARPPDPLDLAEQLRRAYAELLLAKNSPGSNHDDFAEVAYLFAERLGYCGLCGVTLPDSVIGLLPTNIAIAAAHHSAWYIGEMRTILERLPSRFDNATSQFEVDDMVCEQWEARLNVHAAFLAIDEAYMSVLDADDSELPDFRRAIDSLLDRIETYDDALRQHLDLLSLVTDTNLLRNWRSMLAAEHSDLLPWWLDGTLEAAAERARDEALESLPTPEWWEKVRGRETVLSIPPAREYLRRYVRVVPAVSAGGLATIPAEVPPSWHSPDGAFRAILVAPTERTAAAGPTSIVVQFHTGAHFRQPAEQLLGRKVVFSGVEATIESVLRAKFSVVEATFELDRLLEGDDERFVIENAEWPREPLQE